MKKILISLIVSVGLLGFVIISRAEDRDVAGTFFGNPIPRGNYNFVLKVVLSYNSPWGGIPDNREQLQKRIWDDLLLSYEAHRRRISVERKELEVKISETLKSGNATFDWKEDPEAYARWVEETLGESVEIFESQMEHLAQIKKLRDEVINAMDPIVTEEEAFQEFRNENNNLSVELAEFNTLDEAQEFYQKAMSDPLLWGQAAKKDSEKVWEDRSFRRPGFVALEFLMDMWKFPKDTVYDMVEMKIGDIHSPAPIYKGYGVFKILDIRRADESQFSSQRDSFFHQLRIKKKYQGFKDWLEGLKKEADVQIYTEPPVELFP